MRRTGPCAGLDSQIFSWIGILLFSASRVTEIAFRTIDTLPASIARLLDDASHDSTSGDIAS